MPCLPVLVTREAGTTVEAKVLSALLASHGVTLRVTEVRLGCDVSRARKVCRAAEEEGGGLVDRAVTATTCQGCANGHLLRPRQGLHESTGELGACLLQVRHTAERGRKPGGPS